MRYNPLTRRQFLVGTGGTLLAIPFLQSLVPSRALAASPGAKRFICLAQDNGRYAPHWYPAESEDQKLKAVAGVQYMREMLMRDISGNISQIFGTRFNGAIRDKLMMIRGLDGMWVNKQGHQVSTILAGNLGAGGIPEWEPKPGPSIDYLMAKNVKSNPSAANPNSYLNLGVVSNYWDVSFRFDAANNKMSSVGRELNPSNAFNTLFKNVGTSPTPAPAVSNRRQKAVDLVIENYRKVIGSSKISKDERLLLQEHMDMVSELENSLAMNPEIPAAGCVKPATPGGAADGSDSFSVERVNKQNMDIMIAAIKCGIVNIGTITLTTPTDNTVYRNLGLTGRYHDDYTHNSMSSPEVLKITQWIADQFGYFINALNVEEAGTGLTYLDNSLVYYGNAMGHGTEHTYYDMPVMMAGGLGGRMKTGRFIDYTNRAKKNTAYGGIHSSYQGRNYCALLVTFMQAMGLQPIDYQQPNVSEGFGSDTYEQTDAEAWRKDRKNPLPGILA